MRSVHILSRLMALGLTLAAFLLAQKNPPGEGKKVTELYQENCASCHGADLSGNSAPGLINRKYHFGDSEADLFSSIHDGHIDSGMPAMREILNNAEIRALVVYILE